MRKVFYFASNRSKPDLQKDSVKKELGTGVYLVLDVSSFNLLKEDIKKKGSEYLGINNSIYVTDDMQYQITGNIELIIIKGKVVFINNGSSIVKIRYSEK